MEKEEPKLPYDSNGKLLEVGDTITLTANVKALSADKVTLVLVDADGKESPLATVDAVAVAATGANLRPPAAGPQYNTPALAERGVMASLQVEKASVPEPEKPKANVLTSASLK